ncbi:GAF domain-containing protein [Magnetovibrio sp. PR-2]|uniref:GAF domain-containing protein n=1 Tax=Magnetovibrio sp. PR-2 TaxID=3120356 RepID=UPI002FCE457A
MVYSPDDADRLAALVNYGVLDTDFEEAYDCITRLSARIFHAPISLVSLVDEKRQWFKSAHGLDARETPREYAFCAHAIKQRDVFIVPDATKSDVFKDNPLVTDAPNVIFYAGAPLVNSDGFALGTLCVIDNQPREEGMSEEDQDMLKDFATLVVQLLEQRKEIRTLRREHNTETSLAFA